MQSLHKLKEQLERGDSLLTEGLWDAPKALLLSYALKVTGKNILVITGGQHDFNDFPLLH